jgi:hypothetical protein
MREPMSLLSIRIGDYVERDIEGMWFAGIVEKVNKRDETAVIKYLDDGNIEEDVEFIKLRPLSKKKVISVNENQPNNEQNKRKDTLPRPLAGLVEDDYEIRNSVKPTVFIHDSSSTDEAIIMNGAENKLAAGGGLRALRYLKK